MLENSLIKVPEMLQVDTTHLFLFDDFLKTPSVILCTAFTLASANILSLSLSFWHLFCSDRCGHWDSVVSLVDECRVDGASAEPGLKRRALCHQPHLNKVHKPARLAVLHRGNRSQESLWTVLLFYSFFKYRFSTCYVLSSISGIEARQIKRSVELANNGDEVELENKQLKG